MRRGSAPVDGGSIAETELACFIHTGDGNRCLFDKMSVEGAVEAYAVHALAYFQGPVAPLCRPLQVTKKSIPVRHKMESLIIAAVVTVEIPPEGFVIYQELQPFMLPRSIGKIPCVYGIGTPKEIFIPVKVTVSHDIAEGHFKRWHQLPDKGVITCRLPCKPCRLDISELSICLNRGPDIFCPVLAFTWQFLGKGGEIIKNAAVFCLVVSKMTDGALQVLLGIPQSPHHAVSYTHLTL